MRTIFYHIILCLTFIYGMVLRYPPLWFMKSQKRYKYANDTARQWGRNMLWASGSEAQIIYANDSEKEIQQIASENQAVILISNHQSNLDIPLLLAKFPKPFAFIAKKEMAKWPLIGRWMRSIDCIFLDRKNPRQGMKDMKMAIEKIEKGRSYVIFPEGKRTNDGTIKEFKKGSFKLATDTGAKIVPITIIGTYEIQSRKSLKITPNKNVKLIIDKPVDVSSLSKMEKRTIDEYIHNIITKNYEKYKMN